MPKRNGPVPDRIVAVERAFVRIVENTRQRRDMTQADVGKLIGLEPVTAAKAISRLESGTRHLRYGEAVLLAEAFELRLDGLAETCTTCFGSPPAGFTCNDCGSEAPRE